MKVYEENNQVIVEDIKDFHPQHILNAVNVSGGTGRKTEVIQA